MLLTRINIYAAPKFYMAFCFPRNALICIPEAFLIIRVIQVTKALHLKYQN